MSSLCLTRSVFVLLMTSQSIADDVTMTSLWHDHNCDMITWTVISKSLDIDFIHGDIHGRSSKNDAYMHHSPVMSQYTKHYNDVTWASQCLKSLATWLFVEQLLKSDNKENVRAFPLKESAIWKVFPCLAWHHHYYKYQIDGIIFIPNALEELQFCTKPSKWS